MLSLRLLWWTLFIVRIYFCFILACAHAFYAVGCRVILCARRTAELERVKQELQKLSLVSSITFLVCINMWHLCFMKPLWALCRLLSGWIRMVWNRVEGISGHHYAKTYRSNEMGFMLVSHLRPSTRRSYSSAVVIFQHMQLLGVI